MSKLEIELIPAFSDNYLFLAYDRAAGIAAIVDPGEEAPVLKRLEQLDLKLTHILNTHHHFDHTGANLSLKEKFGLTIVGPAGEGDKIPGLDVPLDDGDTFDFGPYRADILNVGGHTMGHIAYHFANQKAAFVGDTLFALGCGRIFEGTPQQMWTSLSKLKALPADTQVYCAHEYTQANAQFAVTVEPGNEALMQRVQQIADLRAKDIPTVPTTIGLEIATNPFLRPDSANVQQTLDMVGADPAAVFAETRARKDNF